MIFLKTTSNYLTTKYYYDLLEKAAEISFNQKIIRVSKIKHHTNSKFIVGNIVDAIESIFKFNDTYVWLQGILPEESLYRNNQKMRYYILSLIEFIVLKKAKGIIVVSNAQLNHYKTKYKIDVSNKAVVVPCFNTTLNEDAFSNKYDNNIFTYTGSLTEWQCVEETLSIYSKIEKEVPNAFLKILTPNITEAKALVSKFNIKNAEVKYVESFELNKELENVKYGFVIRKNNLVNIVSTPTKLSTYLSNGIIPITTPYVKDFNQVISFSDFKIIEDIDEIEIKIKEHCKKKIDKEKIFVDYKKIFNNYYSKDENIKKMVEFFKNEETSNE